MSKPSARRKQIKENGPGGARCWEVIIVGGGMAGLSAAIYLGRAERETLVIDAGKSMAKWEPDVQNFLGFPEGISGKDLLLRARKQAQRYQAAFVRDKILSARRRNHKFFLRGMNASYVCRRLLLATGILHVPPDIPGVQVCLGRRMFFCKDCDGYRVKGQNIAIYGWTNEAVEYALAMLTYSRRVAILTDGRKPRWDGFWEQQLEVYGIPVHQEEILKVRHERGQIQFLLLEGGAKLPVAKLFTTRGDIYFNSLAKGLGAEVDSTGEIEVQLDMSTTVEKLYAAGCVTPANCQMIIAAGQGAIAAQAINRDIFEERLKVCALHPDRVVR